MKQDLPENNNCGVDDYSVCVTCGDYEECGCKDFIEKGRVNGLSIYLSILITLFTLLIIYLYIQ